MMAYAIGGTIDLSYSRQRFGGGSAGPCIRILLGGLDLPFSPIKETPRLCQALPEILTNPGRPCQHSEPLRREARGQLRRYTPRNPPRSVHGNGILVEGRRRALQVFVELSDKQVIENLRSQDQE